MKRYLTFEDLEEFYSTHKNSFHFCAENEDDAVVVQVPGKITFSADEYDEKLLLTPVHLQSSHIGINRNKSSISKEVMEACMKSIHNRPLLGYVHQLSDGSYDFAGHEMRLNEETNEIEYEEIAVGVIPESCNEQLVYDEEKGKTYLEIDGYIFDEYTRASSILKEKGTCKVSVELALLDYAYSAKEKCLQINKFVFTGVTILGTTRDENECPIEEGMYGSNIKLKDFKQNNSMFSSIPEEQNTKLIETLERLNTTLSSLNIDTNTKEGGLKVENFEEEVKDEIENISEDTENTTEVTEAIETESTEETVETTEVESTEVVETEESESETFDESSDNSDSTEDEDDEDEEDKLEEDDSTVGSKTGKKGGFSKTFELSQEDIRSSLYALLASYEETNNDWYFIVQTYDNHFIYQGMMGDYHGQKYTVKEDSSVAFEGEPYTVYAEFVTEEEKASLDEMRSNYSSVVTELNSYKEAEELADKMTVFEDDAYASYLDTAEFKSLMAEDNVKKFSKEELTEKADATLGKLVKTQGTFAYKAKNEEKKVKPSFFAYAKRETESSFLDGLLKK